MFQYLGTTQLNMMYMAYSMNPELPKGEGHLMSFFQGSSRSNLDGLWQKQKPPWVAVFVRIVLLLPSASVTTLVGFRLLGRDPASRSLALNALATSLRLSKQQKK